MIGSHDERSGNDAHVEIESDGKSNAQEAPVLAPTKVWARETRGKRNLLQRSKGLTLRAQETPSYNKENGKQKSYPVFMKLSTMPLTH